MADHIDFVETMEHETVFIAAPPPPPPTGAAAAAAGVREYSNDRAAMVATRRQRMQPVEPADGEQQQRQQQPGDDDDLDAAAHGLDRGQVQDILLRMIDLYRQHGVADGGVRAVLVNPYLRTCLALKVKVERLGEHSLDVRCQRTLLDMLGVPELETMAPQCGGVDITVTRVKRGNTALRPSLVARAPGVNNASLRQPSFSINGVHIKGRALVFRQLTTEPLTAPDRRFAVVPTNVCDVEPLVTWYSVQETVMMGLRSGLATGFVNEIVYPARMLCLNCQGPAPLKCRGCMYARYCSRECQRMHWGVQHRRMCLGPRGFLVPRARLQTTDV